MQIDKDVTIDKMKREVRELIDLGRIPATVTSFCELHDYIDANELGGFCDDEFADKLIEHFGGRDENEGMPDAMLDFINDCQDAVGTWLKAGRP